MANGAIRIGGHSENISVLIMAAIAVVLLAVGIVYLEISASALPAFMPGHLAHERHVTHYNKGGTVCIALAALLFFVAYVNSRFRARRRYR